MSDCALCEHPDARVEIEDRGEKRKVCDDSLGCRRRGIARLARLAGRIDALAEHVEATDRRVDEVAEGPRLGLATTGGLLEELQARALVGGYASYRTVDSH